MSNRVLSSFVDSGRGQRVESPTILCLKILHDGPCPHMAKGKCRDPDRLDHGDKCEHGDITPREKSIFDITVETITTKNSKDLFYGTVSGLIAGVGLIRVGKIAAFGLGGGILLLHLASECGYINVNWERVKEAANRSQDWIETALCFMYRNSCYCVGFAARPSEPVYLTPELPPPPDPPLSRPEDITPFEKPAFLPVKPFFHSAKISPSSIPNPSPSIMSNKQMESPGYPNYGNYFYSIPGYSAFQPVSYSGIVRPQPLIPSEIPTPEYTPFPTMKETEEKIAEPIASEPQTVEPEQPPPPPPPQMDFEEQFQPEITKITVPDDNNKTESKMSITSLAQGSGATVTIPSQTAKDTIIKKPAERFSLKTSIPISKLDLKCVTNTTDSIVSQGVTKKPTTFNPAFITKPDSGAKVEIQSNIIIKPAVKETEVPEKQAPTTTASIISTLLNAAETVNKNDSQFRKVEPKTDVINEIKDPPPIFPPTTTNITRPVFNPINIECSKASFPPKPTEGNFGEQKNQILLIQNNKNQNPKMLLTIQQQNPQVLLQRTNFDSKNGQVPSRLSSQSKNCKEDIIENGTSSKVVALKRTHQENCDENDFENLITENQIYGNKIVVKEKSQGTLQEQDLKNKKTDKQTQETKNVVLQPNFVYLSNVQFPNLMMIKNNAKVNQTETNQANKITPNEKKISNEASTMTNSSDAVALKTITPQNVNASKEIHVLKSNNNVLQTLSNKNSNTDVVFQAPPQKVIMNSQIVYQLPVIVDADNKLNQQYPKLISQNKKELPNQVDQKQNDKLFIACPYQMDTTLQPKIVITNIRPKKLDEVSALDVYEKRKRMRRMKYLLNREPKDTKETAKTESKKTTEKVDSKKNILTPEKITEEIYKEFAHSRMMKVDEESSESESDYGEGDVEEYKAVMKEYAVLKKDDGSKAEFLTNFGLGTKKVCKDKELDRQERIIRKDSVASACIAAGRLDRLMNEDCRKPENIEKEPRKVERKEEIEKDVTLQMKHMFLSELKLTQVTPKSKEGYEKIWQEVLRERNRRNGVKSAQISKETQTKPLEFDPESELKILIKIKKSVNENNNLIKKRLDTTETENAEGDSIHTLAEKNITELNKLSKLADRSVKIMSGQESRKRDLNPGFDSSNIQKVKSRLDQNLPCINVPKINTIISLKSQDSHVVQTQTSQATSMDEPSNSAAGAEGCGRRDAECQVDVALPWPGLDAVIKSYREYDAVRKREIADMQKHNTSLRVDGAHITRAASRDSDQARALLAERQLLANEEANVQQSIHKLQTAVLTVRNYGVNC